MGGWERGGVKRRPKMNTRKRFDRYVAANGKGPDCRWCGRELTRDIASTDHLVPLSVGGAPGIRSDNIDWSCCQCNGSRQSKSLIEFGEYMARRVPGVGHS